jgi:hypothetical protein
MIGFGVALLCVLVVAVLLLVLAASFRRPREIEYDVLCELPIGWTKRFGVSMLGGLNEVIKNHGIQNYKVLQVKEKFGQLRWYDSGVPDRAKIDYYKWLGKYEALSEKTCQTCGKAGKERTIGGWISILCDRHAAGEMK